MLSVVPVGRGEADVISELLGDRGLMHGHFSLSNSPLVLF